MFDHFISLGAWCQTAYQIEKHNFPHTKSCFDWLVTPWDGLISILETQGARFGTAATYDPISDCIKCDHYGVLYAHEFKKDSLGKPVITDEQLLNCRSKLLYKHNKMATTLEAGGSVLFVRFGGAVTPATAFPHNRDFNPRNEADLNHLVQLLQEKYLANTVSLLYLWQEPIAPHNLDLNKISSSIMVMRMPYVQTDAVTWMGNTDVWAAIFERVRILQYMRGKLHAREPGYYVSPNYF
ncbi:Putative papain-like cysteine peptidase [Phyllobacterium sp. OV277]|nr:Putative papain-like cysteine peptidase [Phyllobacterium sp. OV277]